MPDNSTVTSAGQVPVFVQFFINDRPYAVSVAPDMTLFELLRDQGFSSVKCGCESSNCGLCTVWLEGMPILSCSILVAQIHGKHVTTLESLQQEALRFGEFLADEGGDQCGFCVPGMVMNALWLARTCKDRGFTASDDEIRDALLGNLCRCSGYQVHTRAIRRYLDDILATA